MAVLSLGLLILFVQGVDAQDETEPVKVEVLARDDCRHCQNLKEYLAELSESRNDFVVTYYDIYEDEGKRLFEELTKKEGLLQATPLTLIGGQIIQGFGSADTTGLTIEETINFYVGRETPTIAEYLSGDYQAEITKTTEACAEECEMEVPEQHLYVEIPFVGSVDMLDYSLPLMAVVLGFVDGFNPCAMWVLVTFIMILVQVGDRKKMLTFVGLFILAEAVMYYLILTVWFSAWNFIGLSQIVTPLVGLLSIGGGGFFLYEWKTSDGACKVTNMEQRAKTSNKIQELANKPLTWGVAAAIIGLAFSVNVIEFACSIGIPQAFTKILDMNELTVLTAFPLMFVYILFYMLDDMVVFAIALYAIEKIGLTTKYTKATQLIGGVLMIGLGLMLIFRPEWLMF